MDPEFERFKPGFLFCGEMQKTEFT